MYRFIILLILSTKAISENDDEDTAKWLINVHGRLNRGDEQGNREVISSNQDSVLNLDPIQKGVRRVKRNDTKEEPLNLDPDAKVIAEYLDVPSIRPGIPLTDVSRNEVENVTNTSNDVRLDQTLTDEIRNCTRADNEPGVCVLYFQCDPDTGHVIEDGSTLIDVRMSDSGCPHYLQVCCTTSQVIAKPQTSLDSLPDASTHNSSTCGWSNPALNIFQSKDTTAAKDFIYANYGDFPWMIALIKNRNGTDEWSRTDYLGGGSLIHPAVVITAAHKVQQYKPHEIKCRAGEWDTQTTYELFEHQERPVSKIIIHEDYFRVSVYNDIAVLFLKKPFDLDGSPNINIACVGSKLPDPGTLCYSMGWGSNFKNKKQYAVILKKVRIPLVGAEKCQSLLRKSRLGPFFTLHKSLMCAGGEEGVDTCRGDGGSSLACPMQTLGENTRYSIFGMVAYGLGCGAKDLPSVYVNLPHLKPWLDATIAAEGLQTQSYDF